MCRETEPPHPRTEPVKLASLIKMDPFIRRRCRKLQKEIQDMNLMHQNYGYWIALLREAFALTAKKEAAKSFFEFPGITKISSIESYRIELKEGKVIVRSAAPEAGVGGEDPSGVTLGPDINSVERKPRIVFMGLGSGKPAYMKPKPMKVNLKKSDRVLIRVHMTLNNWFMLILAAYGVASLALTWAMWMYGMGSILWFLAAVAVSPSPLLAMELIFTLRLRRKKGKGKADEETV